MRADKLAGAAEGMGSWGRETQALAREGWMQPDLMTGLTLFLLSNQPRDPAKSKAMPGGGGGVAGGVWVRERFTIHRPLLQTDAFLVRGSSMGRYVRKGRRYGTTSSETLASNGEGVATNLTTGLLQYRVEEGLADAAEGVAPDIIDPPIPDWSVAHQNPDRDRLATLAVNDGVVGSPVEVGLALMQARDTKTPDNPIHSDPELARKAGLSRPIAGGSHVLAFVLELVMQCAGRHSLLHGASFDLRWKAPVHADQEIQPIARVVESLSDRVVFLLEARLKPEDALASEPRDDDVVAMTGQVTIPIT